MNKRVRFIWFFLSVIFAVGAVVIGNIYDNKKKENFVGESSIKNSKGEIQEASLYFDKSKVFLAEEITTQKVNSMNQLAKSNEDKKMMKDIKQKLDIQNRFNDFFEQPVLVGNQFKEKIQMKSNLEKENVDILIKDVKTLNKDKNQFYEGILVYLSESDGSDKKTLKESSMVEEAQKAQTLIDTIIVNGEVQPNFTLEQYYEAKQSVDLLEDSPVRTQLLEKITQIQTALTNMGITF